jgi:hypothetical protein
LSFDCFFLKDQSILVPNEVWDGLIDIIFFHAIFKLFNDIFVVRVLSKTKLFAVVQNIGEALLVALAQLFYRNLHLLLFDVGILFSLGSSWKTLPRERSLQEIKEHVANGL